MALNTAFNDLKGELKETANRLKSPPYKQFLPTFNTICCSLLERRSFNKSLGFLVLLDTFKNWGKKSAFVNNLHFFVAYLTYRLFCGVHVKLCLLVIETGAIDGLKSHIKFFTLLRFHEKLLNILSKR